MTFYSDSLAFVNALLISWESVCVCVGGWGGVIDNNLRDLKIKNKVWCLMCWGGWGGAWGGGPLSASDYPPSSVGLDQPQQLDLHHLIEEAQLVH